MKQHLIATAFSSVLVVCAQAASISFEEPTYTGSTSGTLLTGQDLWYNPVAGSRDGSVVTYAGNTLGFAPNPQGGQQFAVTTNDPASGAFGRAQRDFDFNSSDIYTVTFDHAVLRNGALPASNNVASFSLQSSGTARFFQSLMTWDDLSTGAAYDMNYTFFSSATPTVANAAALLGPEWDALPLNTWFRHSMSFNLATNQLMSISIENLETGLLATVSPQDAWLWGGPDAAVFNGRPRPTGVRFFSGGGAGVENLSGWDNLSVVPEPASISLLAIGGALLLRRRRATTATIG